MDAKEIRNLQEAYNQVYQLDEGRRTSLSALSRESQQREADEKRGRPETKAETHGRLMLGKFSPSASKEERAEGGRERLRDRGKVPQKGGKDMFEHILEHLVAEGYADTNKAALAIMANMSEEWKQDIVEGMTMKDFKANRKKLQRKEASDDAKKRGHVDKFTGKPYGTAEAASRRRNLNPAERESRRKFAEDPN
jgi:hypothetical protein